MLDLAVRGGHVVDGTGAPRRRADVGVVGGRVVVVGDLEDDATTTIDATDLVVTPGFVDVHTHLDVQGFWDPTLSPSPLHGVTTVIGGNCGFSVAPVDDESVDYVVRMLARVEGMPLATLRQGVPWDWRTTAEYLDRLEGRLAIHAGFMVGHSALRRLVMRADATRRAATDAEVAAMAALLHAGLAAGGLGFSSSWGFAHRDDTGVPVPSNHAGAAELVALAAVCRDHPGTSLEFIPPQGTAAFDEATIELMADMSAAARRPLNWNVLAPTADTMDVVWHNLAAADRAAAKGGHVVALTTAIGTSLRFSFQTGFVLDSLPGWAPVMALPDHEKLAVLADPARRRALEEGAAAPGPAQGLLSRWGDHVLLDTHAPETRELAGRMVADVARARGVRPFDALLDVVCADRLRTGFGRPAEQPARRDLEARLAVWRDRRALIGGSDAGAHLDMLGLFTMTSAFLQTAVREHGLLPLEEAVAMITSAPARLYGLRDRGVVRVGARADLVVLDEHTVGSTPLTTRFDLPAGAGRIYAEGTGISHLVVDGVIVTVDGAFTGATPGRVLRSGIDTDTPDVMPPG